MSERPFQSPDLRRSQSTDPNACAGPRCLSDRSQAQAQPRGILRQPQNHGFSPVSRSPEFDQVPSRRIVVQQQPNPDIRAPRRDRIVPAAPLLMPRVSEIDTENDSVARACGQTPSPSLRYRAESHTSSQVESEHASMHFPAPRANLNDPRKLFKALDELLHACDLTSSDRFRLHDYLEWVDIRAIQLREREEREERDKERSRFAQMRSSHAKVDTKMVVIRAPLHDVVLYASTPVVIEGTTYDIPIIVHSCIDILRRTAIYQQGLFVRLPNRRRCDKLIDYFNYGPSFGEGFDLKDESAPDVCCLLSTFLMALPEPLIDLALFEPLFRWCVKPSCKRDDEKRDSEAKYEDVRMTAQRRGEQIKPRDFLSKSGTVRWTKKEERKNEELEKPQIAIAVVLFKLLPSAHFALLVYLLGFFTELPLCPDNGMTLEESTKKFAEKLMGGSKANSRTVMMWLLTRWPRISDELFSDNRSAYEEAKQTKLSASAASSPQEILSPKSRTDLRNGLYRSATISSVQLYESNVADALSCTRDQSTCGLYRSPTSSSAVPYDPRFPQASEDRTSRSEEKHHPDFAQTPVIQCNKEATESDKASFISDSTSVYSTSGDNPSLEAMNSIRQQLSAKEEELAVRTTELTAQTKRHNDAIQVISRMKEEARLSTEYFRALRDDMKRLDRFIKERLTCTDRQREEDRQMISDMKKMQKALEARLIEKT